MPFKLILPKKILKDLSKIDNQYLQRIHDAIDALEVNPYIGKKLEGKLKNERSYDVRPYRIIYQIRKNELIIYIVRIGHRQGVY